MKAPLLRITLRRVWAGLFAGRQEGAALIVSLMVLLILVLLALSLLIQSQTEHVVAVNENDALAALSYGESGLEWAERKIKDSASGSPDLDDVLEGYDDAPGGGDDNFIGFRTTLDSSIGLADLNKTNEQTTAVIVNYDWDGNGALPFEAFRVGKDDNGDNVWDGPRAILYVRIEDNYDHPADNGLQDIDDEDWTARIRVISDYPIFVNDDGSPQDPFLSRRGIARRKLEARIGPAQGIAIRTNKEFLGAGSPTVCGECGGVHSNGNMEINGSDTKICGDATATGDYDANSDPAIEGFAGGNQAEQFIPTINPYDNRFVPSTGTFDHSSDGELFADLQCGPPNAADPGASKYFALVFKKGGGQNLAVYKAYWDFTSSSGAQRWIWRLIDVGPTLDAVLDNCGRVVSSSVAGVTADPCPAGNRGCDGSGFASYGVSDAADCCGSPWPVAAGGDGNTYCFADGCTGPGGEDRCYPDGEISACDDLTSGDAAFYGFTTSGNYSATTCTSDDSLMGLTENDFTRNDFYLYGGGNNTDTNVPALPGSLSSDNVPDFDYSEATQPNRQRWRVDTGQLFAPMYNSVLFVFGNLEFNGAMDLAQIFYYDPDLLGTRPSGPGTYGTAIPGGRWRVSPISYGRVQARGTPRFAPANGTAADCDVPRVQTSSCFMVGMVAGRDLDLAGGAGSACADPSDPTCNICPDWITDPTADCAQSGTAPFGYEGMFVAHEQVNLSGSSNMAGFVIAEEAAYCVEPQPPGTTTRMNGTPDIYYNCDTPPDPWLAEALKVSSWEEIP